VNPTGKTTLGPDLAAGDRQFVTIDDETVLAAARSDPARLPRSLPRVV